MRATYALIAAAMAMLASPTLAQGDTELEPQTGTVTLADARARIALDEAYVFYGPDDARTIIVDIWDNRPEQAEGVLGIIMPAGISPRQEGWGGIVTYAETGWISSDDARNADYDAVLSEMQEQVAAENLTRREQSLPELSLVGWAQPPVYDSVSHALVWARELDFADSETNALSYDMRLLGRYGALSINFVSDMDQLPAIRLAAREIGDATTFAAGARYGDYDAATDNAAGYGLAGLVAGSAGLAVAKQFGALALLAKFAKPLLVALGLLIVLLFTPFRRIFRRGNGDEMAGA